MGSQQDMSDSASMHSPGVSEASAAQSAQSGWGSVPQEEPAMISFEDEVVPTISARSTAGAAHDLLQSLKAQGSCSHIQSS